MPITYQYFHLNSCSKLFQRQLRFINDRRFCFRLEMVFNLKLLINKISECIDSTHMQSFAK